MEQVVYHFCVHVYNFDVKSNRLAHSTPLFFREDKA
jgi:hypothetical protein